MALNDTARVPADAEIQLISLDPHPRHSLPLLMINQEAGSNLPYKPP
jgi:hypothetical protein